MKDAISRQYVIEKLNGMNGTAELDKVFEIVENAPSVTPKGVTVTDFADKCMECGKQQESEWVVSFGFPPEPTTICKKCGFDRDFNLRIEPRFLKKIKYCPNCGAKIKGVEE